MPTEKCYAEMVGNVLHSLKRLSQYTPLCAYGFRWRAYVDGVPKRAYKTVGDWRLRRESDCTDCDGCTYA
jgi:hypothetical protein